MKIKAEKLEEILSMCHPNTDVDIKEDGIYVIMDEDHVNKLCDAAHQIDTPDAVPNNMAEFPANNYGNNTALAEQIATDLKPYYNQNNDTLDYDPVVKNINNAPVIDNYENEKMISNASPALYSVAKEIRSNNGVVAEVVGEYTKRAAAETLEYIAQAIVNAADASAFDSEMRIMCHIIDKDKKD